MQILVIRTSAMGDVALMIPVFASIRNQHPGIEIILVTRPAFAPLFYQVKGLKLVLPDFKKRHRGLRGLIILYRDIKKAYNINYVVDLHDVIRSKIIRWLFRISGKPVSVIDKGRNEKKKLIKGQKKVQLKHTVDRYFDVFIRAGVMIQPDKGPFINPTKEVLEKLPDLKGVLNIGIAPYAKHKLKVWPEDNMIRLLALIAEKQNVKYWLFGGNDEIDRLKVFQSRVSGSRVASDNLNLFEELAFIKGLDFMIAMDSSNMHLASLAGTQVISIWGGTDPLAGFGAWHQPDEFAIRIPVKELSCRPCTVFGKGECHRGDFACMNWITPEKVFEKLVNLKII